MCKTLIEPNTGDHCLTIHFLDKDGGTVKKFQFYNFVRNGDTLALAMADWVNCGILPVQTKGLIEIN